MIEAVHNFCGNDPATETLEKTDNFPSDTHAKRRPKLAIRIPNLPDACPRIYCTYMIGMANSENNARGE